MSRFNLPRYRHFQLLNPFLSFIRAMQGGANALFPSMTAPSLAANTLAYGTQIASFGSSTLATTTVVIPASPTGILVIASWSNTADITAVADSSVDTFVNVQHVSNAGGVGYYARIDVAAAPTAGTQICTATAVGAAYNIAAFYIVSVANGVSKPTVVKSSNVATGTSTPELGTALTLVSGNVAICAFSPQASPTSPPSQEIMQLVTGGGTVSSQWLVFGSPVITSTVFDLVSGGTNWAMAAAVFGV